MNDCIIFEGGGHFGGKYPAGHAHRKALEKKLGRPIRPGYECCHTCDTPMCINPDHLWEGTHQENIQDAAIKGRMKGNRKCTGLANVMHTHPKSRAYGDRNGMRIHNIDFSGERNPQAKLSDQQVIQLVKDFLSPEFQSRPRKHRGDKGFTELGRKYNITNIQVRNILRKKGAI